MSPPRHPGRRPAGGRRRRHPRLLRRRAGHVASFYGLILGIMFLVFQAPDVALSQITVGAVALPLMIVLALAKVRALGGRKGGEE